MKATDRPGQWKTTRLRLNRLIRRGGERISDWLLGRTPRERVLVVGGVFLLVALLWQGSFFTPAATRISALSSQVSSLESQNEQLEATLQNLRQQQARAENPDLEVEEAIESLEGDIETLEQALVDGGVDFIAMVPMREAMGALQRELEKPDAPRVIRFDRHPGEGLDGSDDADPGPIDIEHREITMVFEANFPQTLDFLASLEQNDIQVVWRALDYEVTEHPMARVTVRFDLYAPANFD